MNCKLKMRIYKIKGLLEKERNHLPLKISTMKNKKRIGIFTAN